MSSNKNLISVLTPTYNRSALIAEGLESVVRQDYRPIEIVIVDDGSTDNTRDVIEDWKSKNSDDDLRLEYFYQENAGPGAARNLAFQHCQGELIQYLDSDDKIYPDRFSKLASLFESNPELDFVQTGFEGFCADCGEVFETHRGKPEFDQLSLALRGRLWPNTLRSMFRRRVVELAGGWNTEMSCFEDYEFVVRTFEFCRQTSAVEEVLASASRGGMQERVTDKLRTHEGRGYRIQCEKALANVAQKRNDIEEKYIQEFVSRIYALGARCYAMGWSDHGKKCRDIAGLFDIKLDAIGKRRKMVCRLGKWGGQVYDSLGKFKRWITGTKPKLIKPHQCGSGA